MTVGAETFDGVAELLFPGKNCEPFRVFWDDSQDCFPEQGAFFLEEGFILESDEVFLLPGELLAEFLAAARAIKECPELARMAWHWHRLLYVKWDFPPFDDWPEPERHMGGGAWMFHAVVAISGLPGMLAAHRRAGISFQTTIETIDYLRVAMEYCRERKGHWGLLFLSWITTHFKGRIYRLGRLYFQMSRFAPCVIAFRNRGTGEIVSLSEKGIRYRRDGLVDGTNGVFDSGAWVSVFEEDDVCYAGHIVEREGRALRDIVKIDKREWEKALSGGDLTLDVHVPASPRLYNEMCHEAYRSALEFFPRHFPDYAFKAFTCYSWLMDSQLRLALPEDSNIVLFQKDYSLFPLESDDSGTLDLVFKGISADLAKAPRDTLLQRAILDQMEQGRRFHGAGGFFLREEAEKM